MKRPLALALVAVCVAALGLAVPPGALAAHSLRFTISQFEPRPGLLESFEGPCGTAVDSHGNIYVSDYYHGKIDVFTSSGSFVTQIAGVNPLDGPCGLAVDSSGRIYANAYHQGVLELIPSSYPPTPSTTYSTPVTVLAGIHATGIALDPVSGNLWVDERTSVAEYEAPVEPGSEPLLRIGSGSLRDGYGVAVSGHAASAGRVYVADAETATVQVYDPATSLTTPVAAIDGSGMALGRFNDLTDAALAVDEANGHLYVSDNIQGRLYEHPLATIAEFDPAGQLQDEVKPNVVDGSPIGLAVDNSATATASDLYVTSGNTEKASLLAFSSDGSSSSGSSLTGAAPATVPVPAPGTDGAADPAAAGAAAPPPAAPIASGPPRSGAAPPAVPRRLDGSQRAARRHRAPRVRHRHRRCGRTAKARRGAGRDRPRLRCQSRKGRR